MGENPSRNLRQRAEDALQGKPIDIGDLPVKDIQYLLHELQVHQVELTLQNEELRRSHLELEVTRDRYSDLFNFAPSGYCTLDERGTILEANQALASMLGVEQAKLIHSKLSDYVVREDQDKYYLYRQHYLEADNHQTIVIQLVSQSGEKVFVQLEGVMDHEDKSRILMILSNITERMRAEEELQHYTRELEHANQALQDFAYIASHDLQEPLRKVKAFGLMLETRFGEELGAEGKDYLFRMISATDRMESMLQGLLAYSRVSIQSISFVNLDLHKIAREVISDLEGRLLQTGGKVELGELPVVLADPIQMRQLLQNLIGNALKYHRKNVPPLVKVSSKAIPNNLIELSVSDNGIGLDMKEAGQIFLMFHRLHGISEYEGSGIGLAICKKIVERHRGTITVISNPGEGATFTVTLPAT